MVAVGNSSHHCMTIRKAELLQRKPGSPWENWSIPTITSQLHVSCATQTQFGTISRPSSMQHTQGRSSFLARRFVKGIQGLNSLPASNCMWHNQGRFTSFRRDEHNVESFSSSGSVMLQLPIRIFLQRLTGC